jgi:hypothetical protein
LPQDTPLVRSLPPGPADIVGDVHGEIDALLSLLHRLGYSENGEHPEGRRLVFVGDLTDRGPDSPAVVALVSRLVERERGWCVLGNHELNLLRREHKHGNAWFYGKQEALGPDAVTVPQVKLGGESERQRVLDFFASLPLALEREDLRVVHACWDSAVVESVRHETDALRAFTRFEDALTSRLAGIDGVERELSLQNENPVKILTSGPERRVPRFWAAGKWRGAGRVAWWNDYRDGPYCVFGHYWRVRLPWEPPSEILFDNNRMDAEPDPGRAVCIDYSVGKRWDERLHDPSAGFRTRLAALRWPERLLVFDQ